jgi:hypothetical protein
MKTSSSRLIFGFDFQKRMKSRIRSSIPEWIFLMPIERRYERQSPSSDGSKEGQEDDDNDRDLTVTRALDMKSPRGKVRKLPEISPSSAFIEYLSRRRCLFRDITKKRKINWDNRPGCGWG